LLCFPANVNGRLRPGHDLVFTCVTENWSAGKTLWSLFSILLRFVHVRLKQGAFSTLLPHHAHYVGCSHFVLYVPILFVKFVVAESFSFSFPFNYKIVCQLMSYLVEMLYWLIKTFYCFHSDSWHISFLFFGRRENLKYEFVLIIP